MNSLNVYVIILYCGMLSNLSGRLVDDLPICMNG